MTEKVYLLFKGSPGAVAMVGAYSKPEHALAMALHIMRAGEHATVKIDAYQLDMPIPIRMPGVRK